MQQTRANVYDKLWDMFEHAVRSAVVAAVPTRFRDDFGADFIKAEEILEDCISELLEGDENAFPPAFESVEELVGHAYGGPKTLEILEEQYYKAFDHAEIRYIARDFQK